MYHTRGTRDVRHFSVQLCFQFHAVFGKSGQNNRLALTTFEDWAPKTLENLESGFVSVTDNSLRLHLTTKNLLTINYIKDRS